MKDIFRSGAIDPTMIAESIANHQHKTNIGAHYIFLGQVRADEIDGTKVSAIEYTAQQEIANKVVHHIREEAFSKFDLSCMHIYHSLGEVKAGEICFMVFVSSAHREEPYKAVQFLVNAIKEKAPIFGKELFEDGSHQWKENEVKP